MIMVEIDTNTGLPTLPEGYFWRVGESVLEIRQSLPDGKWSAWGDVPFWWYGKELPGYEFEAREVEASVGGGLWFFGDRKARLVTQHRCREVDRSRRTFRREYGEWERMTYAEDGMVCVVSDPMTRDNLLERATETYHAWQAQIATDALLGDYPPKSFS